MTSDKFGVEITSGDTVIIATTSTLKTVVVKECLGTMLKLKDGRTLRARDVVSLTPYKNTYPELFI